MADSRAASSSGLPLTPSGAGEPKYTFEDFGTASELYLLAASCRDVADDEWTTRKSASGSEYQIYRPKVETRTVDGQELRVYTSLCSKDPSPEIVLTWDEYSSYLTGEKMGWHMPFISNDLEDQINELLRGYSTFTDRCSFDGHEFDPELHLKVKMLVLKRFLPPAFYARARYRLEQGQLPIGSVEALKAQIGLDELGLSRMCHLHFLFSDKRKGLALNLQAARRLPRGAERTEAFRVLIDQIFERLKERQQTRGARLISKEEIGNQLVAYFATQPVEVSHE